VQGHERPLRNEETRRRCGIGRRLVHRLAVAHGVLESQASVGEQLVLLVRGERGQRLWMGRHDRTAIEA
jgi:hypothetical protein